MVEPRADRLRDADFRVGSCSSWGSRSISVAADARHGPMICAPRGVEAVEPGTYLVSGRHLHILETTAWTRFMRAACGDAGAGVSSRRARKACRGARSSWARVRQFILPSSR